MSRILTLFSSRLRGTKSSDMGDIRWHRVSAALAACGHTVHMGSAELRRRLGPVRANAAGVSTVPITRVAWDEYDMVKTFYHEGWETLERYGGVSHPFIIAHLGSVVGPDDREGIYFYGPTRERLWNVQQSVNRAGGPITLLTEPARELWRECFGDTQPVHLAPGAADTVIPLPRNDPYPADCAVRVVFSGNFYNGRSTSQPEAHRTVTGRLNRLGELLAGRGARLFVVGPGDRRSLDPRFVSYLGAVPYEQSWDFLYFATVGIVVSAGPFQHNNESTKLYYYLRAGLPVVSEAGFPNDHVVREAGLGFVVENGRPDIMADRVMEAAAHDWDRDRAVRCILANHTWDRRVELHDRLLREAAAPAA